MNYSDSERIASVLEKNNLKPVENISKADLAVFNTCGVRQMAEDRVYGQVHNLRKNNPNIKIILTGCLSNRKDVRRILENKVDLFVEIKNVGTAITKFVIANEVKQSRSKNNRLPRRSAPRNDIYNKDYFKIIPKHDNNFQAYVPIMTGCNNFCAYCVVPHARGREISRPAGEIIKEAKRLIKKGYKEITLLGQNVNSYKDGNINFPKLLKKINNLPGKFWLRFISSHPKDMSDELIETIAKSKKACEYVHLPIQAGDDKVLKIMNRKYDAKHYLKLIKKIELAFEKYKPGIIYSLTSDIIVGFPGETKNQFLKSAGIMEKVPYDMVYFGQYSPRPNTIAWKMKDNVSKKEKVRREKYLNEILKKTAFANNKEYVGKVFDVLIEKRKDGVYFGKTRTLKNVKLPSKKKNLVGKVVKVKIIKANIWNLAGTMIK